MIESPIAEPRIVSAAVGSAIAIARVDLSIASADAIRTALSSSLIATRLLTTLLALLALLTLALLTLALLIPLLLAARISSGQPFHLVAKAFYLVHGMIQGRYEPAAAGCRSPSPVAPA